MPSAAIMEKQTVPLCVDLDGTLIKTDLLWESLLLLLKRNPLYLFAVPWWLLRGRANLKAQLAARVEIDPATLPYNNNFLEFLCAEKEQGRSLYLVTASDSRPARRVAEHIKVFDDVLGSDGITNLRGGNKAAMLAERFGERGFDYAGNSSVDFPVWQHARRAVVVNAGTGVQARASQCAEIGRIFSPQHSLINAFVQSLRPHQWVKNLILFVPLVTSHEITRTALAIVAVLAFVAFSLCASGVYVLNDLLDLEADRHHSSKRQRAFASGELPIAAGLIAFPFLLVASFALAWWVSTGFMLVLGLYVALTTSYSWRVKQIALLDAFFLAGLYTIRLIAGHEATGIAYSFWLLAFSMFIFLSLALVKRFRELDVAQQRNHSHIKGRGYVPGDRELVAMLGASSGFMAVLVLALYVDSAEVTRLYAHPALLLLICPLLLYWISRVWLIAHRGQMHDDPIVFALRDRVSYLVGFLTLLVLWLATGH